MKAHWLVLSCVMVLPVSAADLVVSGYRVPLLTANPNTTIDLINGHVTVNTVANQGVKNDGWCPLADVGTKGATAPWVELRFPNAATHRISINAAHTRLLANGDIEVRAVSPGGLQGDGWCPADITWPTPLRAEPASVTTGQTVQLIWASAGAQSCNPDGSVYPQGVSSVANWTGSLPTSSAGRAVVPTVAGNYTFRLNCVSSTGATYTQSVSVTATAPVDPCAGHGPPPGLARATSMVNSAGMAGGANREWAINATLDLTRWDPPPPGQVTNQGINRSVIGSFARMSGETGIVAMPGNAYFAMKAETAGIVNAAGSLSTEQPGQNASPAIMSISRCPGDFTPDDPKCVSAYSGVAGLGWTFSGTPASFCRLTPGVDYYLNVSWTNPANQTNGCAFAQCWWLVTQNCAVGCRPD